MWKQSVWIIIFLLKLSSGSQKGTDFYKSLKEELKEEWGGDNRDCLQDLIFIIDGVQNSTLGPTWMWESLQLPAGVLYGARHQLGAWAQCARALLPSHPSYPSHPSPASQYCLADVTLTDKLQDQLQPDTPPRYEQTVEEYLNTLSSSLRPLNVVTWGACVPASCAPASVRALLALLLRRSALAALPAAPAIDVTCHTLGDTREPPLGYYVFWYFFLVLAIISLLSTYYYTSNTEVKRENTLVEEVTKAFCIGENLQQLVKETEGDIQCLHGMRAMTAILAVYMHYICFSFGAPVVNALDVEKDIDRLKYAINHVDMFIATFFFMSALLTVKGLMRGGQNRFVVLVKRYVRLVSVLAVVVWYTLAVLVWSADGPMWNRLAGAEQQSCSRRWPLTILMLNNLIHTDDICHLVSWYLSADFQLTIAGVVLFSACADGGRVGRGAAAIFAALALLVPAAVIYWYRLPAHMMISVQGMTDLRHNPDFHEMYTKTYYHFGSYFVGMATGYYLTVYKPSSCKKISSRWTVFLLGAAVVYIVAVMDLSVIFRGRPYNVLETVAYGGTYYVIYALCISTIVMGCEYGTPNAVSSLLSWRAWVPLSRLSYGVYLTHPLLIFHSVFSVQAPLTHKMFSLLMNGLGATVLSYAVSLVLWLLVEAPVLHLTNTLLRSKNQTQVTADAKKQK